MRLNETEMVKLLPAWMQEDGSDKGIATGCDIISRDAYARLKLLSRWDKIDQLSDAELDEMAWELNIQWYDSTAPIAAKRAVIRNSDRVYAKLGTPYAVEQIVADYFGTGEVREWYQYGGQPHHFKVLSDNPSLVNSNLDLFLKLLRTVKRRSSWLDAILICLTGEMFLYSGMAVRDHTQEVHVMGSDEIHIYHAAVVHDNNRETVSIGTDAAVISLGGVVISHSVRVGGVKMDEAIIDYIKKHHNLLIGEPMAEEIKLKIGSAAPYDGEGAMEVRGRNLTNGLPGAMEITSAQVREILTEPVQEIIRAIKETLEVTLPELAADIMDRGIYLTGGSSTLRGLADLIEQETKIKIHIPDAPTDCVAIGTSIKLRRAR